MNPIARVSNRSKDLLFVPALDRYWRRQLNGRVVCLLYHRVDSPSLNQFLAVGGSPVIPPDDLFRELSFLKKQGAMFLTFADLRKGIFPLASEFGVIVSFDDCFADNYTHGLEVLDSLEIKGVFFQTTGMIEPQDLIWEHMLYWLNRSSEVSQSFTNLARRILSEVKEVQEKDPLDLMNFLRDKVELATTEHLISCAKNELPQAEESVEAAKQIYAKGAQIKEAHKLGHEIGSHGHLHANRLNINDERFNAELVTSVGVLKTLLGTKPRIFSYPFNCYREGDDRICSRYFQQVATVNKEYISPDTDPMWMPRFTWPGLAQSSLRRRRWLFTGVN